MPQVPQQHMVDAHAQAQQNFYRRIQQLMVAEGAPQEWQPNFPPSYHDNQAAQPQQHGAAVMQQPFQQQHPQHQVYQQVQQSHHINTASQLPSRFAVKLSTDLSSSGMGPCLHVRSMVNTTAGLVTGDHRSRDNCDSWTSCSEILV